MPYDTWDDADLDLENLCLDANSSSHDMAPRMAPSNAGWEMFFFFSRPQAPSLDLTILTVSAPAPLTRIK